MITKSDVDEHNRKTLAKAGYKVRKAMVGDESAADYYDIVDTVQDADPNMARPVRVGDARVMPQKVTFLPAQTMTWETAGDMVVPKDSFLSPDGGEGAVTPVQPLYRCDYPDGQHLHEENFLADGEDSGIVAPADYVPSKPAVLKRASMFGNLIRGFTSGENA